LKKVVNKGTDPKSNVTIMFYGDAKYSAKDAMSMQALGEVLTIKLIEQLRENESGVYGVSARGIMNKIQTDRTVLTFPSADRTMQRNKPLLR
jgi:zinc protease